mmetsp:Transcript_129398/g.307015  ORF Transcript_129398/g.307015 Transcript_129398/m.307015 type:complete len:215 (-) Transcript_129398:777-1421(-)
MGAEPGECGPCRDHSVCEWLRRLWAQARGSGRSVSDHDVHSTVCDGPVSTGKSGSPDLHHRTRAPGNEWYWHFGPDHHGRRCIAAQRHRGGLWPEAALFHHDVLHHDPTHRVRAVCGDHGFHTCLGSHCGLEYGCLCAVVPLLPRDTTQEGGQEGLRELLRHRSGQGRVAALPQPLCSASIHRPKNRRGALQQDGRLRIDRASISHGSFRVFAI